MVTPMAAPDSSVSTTPRRSGSSAIRAPASTAYCQGWLSSRVSVIAEPRMAPIAAGPAPSRKARARALPRICSKRRPAEQDEQEGRGEGDGGGEQPAADPGGGVADDRDGLHDRARA